MFMMARLAEAATTITATSDAIRVAAKSARRDSRTVERDSARVTPTR